VLVLGLLVAVPTRGDAAGATCRGLPVTIEGTPDTDFVGTPGDDVILAPFRGAGIVQSGEGNDVICVVDAGTAPPAYTGFFYVYAGPGDDVIDSSALPFDKRLMIGEGGPGSDIFYGGPAGERSLLNASTSDPVNVDTELDVFAMGGGADLVESGTKGVPNPDRIDLGTGRDDLEYGGSQAPGGSVVGGAGYDTLAPLAHDAVHPTEDPLPPGEVVFDAGTGTASVGGRPYLAWSGFERYDLEDVRRGRITFTGSAGDDVLVLGTNVQHVRMGRGDDVVVNAWTRLPAGGAIDGGAGRDRVWMAVDGVARVDVSRQMSVVLDGQSTTLDLSGFEDATVSARRVALFGTNQDNRLVARTSGPAFVAGKGGDDDLDLGIIRYVHANLTALRLATGGAGDDTLQGSPLDDVLTGGPDQDRAFGHGGRDVCTAELRVGCER
jgi:Ca2+-binding RTX toxin-like protein